MVCNNEDGLDLNILMVTFSFGMGGISRYIGELSRSLANKGHNVFIISIKECERQIKISDDRIELIRLRHNGGNVFSLVIGFLMASKQIKDIVKSKNINIIINNTPLTNLICNLSLRHQINIGNLAVLRVVHGMWAKELCRYGESRTLYGSKLMESMLPVFGSAVERYELNASGNIISVNNEIKEYIATLGVKKDIHVLSAGVDCTRFKPPSTSKSEIRSKLKIRNKQTILFVGNLTEIKGANYLIESASIILKHHNVQFIFVGDGINREKYRSMVTEKGIADAVIFAGQVEDALLPQFYQAADIFCLPSLQEGLPQTLLEAMSTGLPVVATNVGGIPSILVDGANGCIVESKNVDVLSNKIELLIQNQNLAESMGHEARRTILANYSWNIISDKILETIHAGGEHI